jgi:MraZ protein
MYLGQKQLFLESDLQVEIPEQFRNLFAEGAYITRGFEQNLLIMSNSVFEALYERVAELNIADPLARLLLRLIFGNASKVDLTASGHILLPEDLKSFAGLEKELIMVGQGSYLEVWAPGNWEKQTSNLLDAEANSGRFAKLDLASH